MKLRAYNLVAAGAIAFILGLLIGVTEATARAKHTARTCTGTLTPRASTGGYNVNVTCE